MKTFKLTAIITHTIEAEDEDSALERFYELESENQDDLIPDVEEV
jgi:hypothetical protein